MTCHLVDCSRTGLPESFLSLPHIFRGFFQITHNFTAHNKIYEKMPWATFLKAFLCHNFLQFFVVSDFFSKSNKKIIKTLIFYLINLKFSKSRTFESNTAPPHNNNFPRTQGFKSRTNWRYLAHSGNSVDLLLFQNGKIAERKRDGWNTPVALSVTCALPFFVLLLYIAVLFWGTAEGYYIKK